MHIRGVEDGAQPSQTSAARWERAFPPSRKTHLGSKDSCRQVPKACLSWCDSFGLPFQTAPNRFQRLILSREQRTAATETADSSTQGRPCQAQLMLTVTGPFSHCTLRPRSSPTCPCKVGHHLPSVQLKGRTPTSLSGQQAHAFSLHSQAAGAAYILWKWSDQLMCTCSSS